MLIDWSRGDREALESLMPVVYAELRRQAARHLRRERPGHTLQTTDLIHEAYLRLVDQKNMHWQNRAHFFAISAQLMRHILVDHARRRRRAKRGGSGIALPLEEGDGLFGNVHLHGCLVAHLKAHANAYAERFVRSIKESCLDRLILFGENSLREAAREFVAHYHTERNHQGLQNRLIDPPLSNFEASGSMKRRQRIGGMLNYYYRAAA
jgi:hypothetical protein